MEIVTINNVINDLRERAKVAASLPADSTVRNSAVAGMLEAFAIDLQAAWDAHCALDRDATVANNTMVALLKEKDAKLEWLRKYDYAARPDWEKCAKCQTEKTGEGYGEVPPKLGYDEGCDTCPVACRLRALRVSLFKKGVTIATPSEDVK